MKRLSKEKFLQGNWGEKVYVLKIENGNFYHIAEIEEWPDSPKWDKEGYRIFAPYKELELEKGTIFLNGVLSACLAGLGYEITPMIYLYESEEEREGYENIYDYMLSLSQPYAAQNLDSDDYDIFIMSRTELSNFIDAFKDGYYIIILEDSCERSD